MLPTMTGTNEWILEDALTVRFGLKPIARGELVVLVSPRAPTEQVCKRVIGLPGDIVCVDPTGERAPSTEHCLIPKGHIWIQGDNAAGSRDSRYYGPVPIALVRARVVGRVRANHSNLHIITEHHLVLAMEIPNNFWRQYYNTRRGITLSSQSADLKSVVLE